MQTALSAFIRSAAPGAADPDCPGAGRVDVVLPIGRTGGRHQCCRWRAAYLAVLQDGAYGKDLDGKDENGNIRPYHLGHFFIAIDTDHSWVRS